MVLEIEQVGARQNGAGVRESGPWRWTVEQYERAAAAGLFEGWRIELVNGEIIAMMPMGPLHIGSTTNLAYALIDKLPRTFRVLVQMPITLSQSSQPEPDVAVVDAQVIRDRQRPTTAHLVIEVSDSTLDSDRTTKAALYAASQIAEYWILDVNARTLEVMRDPIADAISSSGWRYGQTQTLREDASATPLCAPGVEFDVRDLLP